MLNPERLCPGCMNDCGDEQICSLCGYDRASDNGNDELPVSFWLSDRFMVGRLLSHSSESVLYLGWDNSTDTAVHIKEYFPEGAAVRNPDKTVSMMPGREFAFNEGLMEFMELNRSLIGSELPSLIPTVSVFEENGTAYTVSTVFVGITLKSFLDRNGGSLKWEQARPLFLPLIDTVKGLNSMGIIHGGISPETVIVGRDGKLRLSDICISAVRKPSSEIPPVIYDGYAAPEQYGIEGIDINNYTDTYGLSATLFRVLIGTVPPKATERLGNDSLTIPARFADELPRQVLVSLANGLQVNPKTRSASVDVLKNELVYGETEENVRKAAVSRRADEVSSKKAKKKKKSSGAKYAVISALCTALLFVAAACVLCLTVFKEQVFGSESSDASASADSISAPSVDAIGDVDSDAAVSKQLYAVPDLAGKYYSQVAEDSDEEYERFEISISGKEFSDKYPKGAICGQSIAAGTSVEKDTKIEVTVSLGPKEVKIANVVGLSKEEAIIELLKQGFLYENIDIYDISDSEAKPDVILRQSPEYGTKVSPDTKVSIGINTYEPEEEETTSSEEN